MNCKICGAPGPPTCSECEKTLNVRAAQLTAKITSVRQMLAKREMLKYEKKVV